MATTKEKVKDAAGADAASTTSTALTKVEHQEAGIIGRAVFGGVEDVGLALWSSMPLTNRAQIIQLLQGQTARLGDNIGAEIRVEHVLAHRVEMVDVQSGVVTEGDRIVLVTPDGASYAGVSAGMRKSLQLTMALYGMPPWKGGLLMKVGQVNTRAGRRTYTLSPVE